jgi:2-oxoisovalerate/pyruvate ferredoxin oxidoreductase gamma subunit
MIEIRIHGRGGQGVVVASEILAKAAFQVGLRVQAFPSFGSERRGAPVAAFVRISRAPILHRCEITEPDGVVVLDQGLVLRGLVDVARGLKADGWMLVNSSSPPDRFRTGELVQVATVDASHIAAEHGLGTRAAPIVNTAILGALPALVPDVPLEAILAAIREHAPVAPDANAAAAAAAALVTRLLIPAGASAW